MNGHRLAVSRRRLNPRRFLAFSTALAVTSALSGIVPVTAGAAQVDGSNFTSAAHGDLISVDVAGQNLANAAVTNSNDETPGPDKESLNVSVLESINLNLGDGLQLPLIDNGTNAGLLELGDDAGVGLLGSFAKSPSQITSTASAGAINDDGSLALDTATDDSAADAATINATPLLTQVLGDDLANTVLDEAQIKVGALGAIATKFGEETVSDYTLADLKLDVHSPLVDQVVRGLDTTIEGAVAPVTGLVAPGATLDTTIAGLATGLNAIPLLDVDGNEVSIAGVDALTASVREELLQTQVSNADGTVNIDLSTGTISLDLGAALLNANNATSLNDLEPNTEVLSAEVVTALVNGVTEALTGTSENSLTSKLTRILTEKIYDLELTIALDAKVDPTEAVLGEDGILSGLGDALTTAGLVDTVTDTTGGVVDGATDTVGGVVDAGTGLVGGLIGGDSDTETTGESQSTEDAATHTEDDGSLLGGLTNPASGVLETSEGNIALTQSVTDLTLIDLPITIQGPLGGFLGAEGYAEPTIDIEDAALVGIDVGEVLQPLTDFLQTKVDQLGVGLNTLVKEAVTEINPNLTTAVNTIVTPLIGDTGALKTLLENLASIEVNDQPTEEDTPEEADLGDGSFTVRALNVQLLPNVADSVVNLELGSATVKAADAVTPTTDTVDPVYNNGAGAAGETVNIAAPTFDDPRTATVVETGAAPEGTTFAAATGAPTGVTVDAATGAVSVPIAADATPGTTLTVPVVVTYADQTSDTKNITVTVEQPDATSADSLNPVYQTLTAPIGESTTGVAPRDENGVAFPENTAFALVTTGITWVSVDATTGAVTATPPAGTNVGNYNLRVSVTYPDDSIDYAQAPVNVTAAPLTSEGVEPAYGTGTGLPGEAVTIAAPTFDNTETADVVETDVAPTGTAFAAGTTAPTGTVVDPDTGAITVTIPDTAAVDTNIPVPVVVTYADGSTDSASATVTVAEPITNGLNPEYASVDAPVGSTTTGQAPTAETEIPEGTTYALNANTVATLPWVSVDENTGVLTFAPTADVELGSYRARVGLTYPDGSVDTIDAPVNVVAAAVEETADTVDPRYAAAEGLPGETVTVAAPTFVDGEGASVDKPEGTTFAATGAEIDTNTGELTVAVPADATADIEVPVVVTYADGSTDNVTATITVGDAPVEETVDTGSTDETPAGESTRLDDTVKSNEVTSATVDGVENATVTIENGAVTVTIPADAKAGDAEVVYNDGTRSPITVTVEEPTETTEPETPVSGSSRAQCTEAVATIGGIVLLLAPVGLMTQVNLPGASQWQAQLDQQIKDLNTRLQHDLGVFDPALATWIEDINAQLSSPEVRQTVGAGALVIGGLLAAKLFIDGCVLSQDEE